jgi:hypothetical protein
MNPVYTLAARVILSVLFVVGYSWIVATVLRPGVGFTPEVKEILLFLLGALTTSVVTVVNFWFSSTQGSADKTVAMTR